jgi:hypothetical protein
VGFVADDQVERLYAEVLGVGDRGQGLIGGEDDC